MLDTLDRTVKYKDVAMIGGFEHQHVLEFRPFLVQDFFDAKAEGDAGPLFVAFVEPVTLIISEVDKDRGSLPSIRP